MPADGIVEQQIKLAAKYAMIEGGITSSLYTGTIAATIGSLGGASKAGEVARGSIKLVPGVVRQVLKKYYSGPVLAAAKSLPFVGKHLLQRNIIKFGIPGVGIPLTILMNRYTTVVAGRHAKSLFRGEAEVIELADTLIRRTRRPRLMLWVAWLVINAAKA